MSTMRTLPASDRNSLMINCIFVYVVARKKMHEHIAQYVIYHTCAHCSLLLDSIPFQHIRNKRPNKCILCSAQKMHTHTRIRNLVVGNPHQLSIMPIFNYRVIVVCCVWAFSIIAIIDVEKVYSPRTAHTCAGTASMPPHTCAS